MYVSATCATYLMVFQYFRLGSIPIYICSSVPSSAPQNLSVVTFTTTNISISWSPPVSTEQNGLITSYSIQVYGYPFPAVNNYINAPYVTMNYPATELVTYTLTGLEEFNNYTISVAAVNSNGTGPYTANIIQRTQLDGEYNVVQPENCFTPCSDTFKCPLRRTWCIQYHFQNQRTQLHQYIYIYIYIYTMCKHVSVLFIVLLFTVACC